jgi:hypothetical protein
MGMPTRALDSDFELAAEDAPPVQRCSRESDTARSYPESEAHLSDNALH